MKLNLLFMSLSFCTLSYPGTKEEDESNKKLREWDKCLIKCNEELKSEFLKCDNYKYNKYWNGTPARKCKNKVENKLDRCENNCDLKYNPTIFAIIKAVILGKD